MTITPGMLIGRAEAELRSPNGVVSTNIDPRDGVVGHYGAGKAMWPYTPERALVLVRGWQAYHMDGHGWDDLAYTAVVDLFGRIIIGRGPGARTAANGTNDANAHRYAVCFLMGVNDPLTDAAKIGFLAARRWIRAADPRTGATIVGHRDVRSTSCPGDPVEAWIKAGCPAPQVAGAKPVVVPQPVINPGGRVDVGARMPKLSRGSHGQHVEKLQTLLNVMDKSGAERMKVDGDFGKTTEGFVRRWQTYFKLADQPGVCGAHTWQTLFELPL